MTHLYRNSFFFTSLFLLTSCVMKEQKPERLLPPEPVLIKEDMIVKKSESPKEERGEALPTPQTEEEAQRSLPAWAHAKGDGVYKLGKPYKVNGVWYFPAENTRYDEIGFASRYPKSFQGQRTANGEIYSNTLLTGCHKTLPLPSIVQVTNLSNNKSIVVRLNDRGPFVNDRLLDISDKAATLLEFPEDGNVKVRVEIMNPESKTAAAALQGGEKPAIPHAAYPPPVITKDPETPAPVENTESFVTVASTPAPEESPSEAVFDQATPTSPASQAEILPAEVPPAGPGMAPVEQVSLPEKAYYVQAGLFGNPENAKNLSHKLGSIGLVESSPVTINGRSLHRVRVGPFSSLSDANKVLAQTKKGYNLPDARIVNP
ncbi:MAG: hypothetical protein A2065_01950 [Alphaproteobacteria bacterium GWB1_45_5]|nr:MAG: hypothetical protein A2065_01950 [Alphaproteobacteria bacterium GWB1_45_5]